MQVCLKYKEEKAHSDNALKHFKLSANIVRIYER